MDYEINGIKVKVTYDMVEDPEDLDDEIDTSYIFNKYEDKIIKLFPNEHQRFTEQFDNEDTEYDDFLNYLEQECNYSLKEIINDVYKEYYNTNNCKYTLVEYDDVGLYIEYKETVEIELDKRFIDREELKDKINEIDIWNKNGLKVKKEILELLK